MSFEPVFVISAFCQSCVLFRELLFFVLQVVTALPEEMRPGLNPSALPWELVIGAAIVGFVTVVLFLWRSFCSVSNQCFLRKCLFYLLKYF